MGPWILAKILQAIIKHSTPCKGNNPAVANCSHPLPGVRDLLRDVHKRIGAILSSRSFQGRTDATTEAHKGLALTKREWELIRWAVSGGA